jgi:hypothetical protein
MSSPTPSGWVPGLGAVSSLSRGKSPPRARTATTVALEFGEMRLIETSGWLGMTPAAGLDFFVRKYAHVLNLESLSLVELSF